MDRYIRSRRSPELIRKHLCRQQGVGDTTVSLLVCMSRGARVQVVLRLGPELGKLVAVDEGERTLFDSSLLAGPMN